MNTVTVLNETYNILDRKTYNDLSRKCLGHPRFQRALLRKLEQQGIVERVDSKADHTSESQTASHTAPQSTPQSEPHTTTHTATPAYTIQKRKSLLSEKTLYILTVHTRPDDFTYIITDPDLFETKCLLQDQKIMDNPVLFNQFLRTNNMPVREIR